MSATQRGASVATYVYEDEMRWALFCVDRYVPKSFGIRHPVVDEHGGTSWVPGLGNARRVLYRLPELLAAAPERLVYVCEGEKDADALAALGLVATTNYGGAGSWHDEYTVTLAGRDVVLLPDNDDAGRKRADRLARDLLGTARSTRTLLLPGLPDSGDVSDWLAAGGTAAELERLANGAAPEEPVRKGPRLITRNLAEVEPEPVNWLWEGWLPRGKLSLIGGHPGDGKSTLTTAMAAILSTGGIWPDGSRAPTGATLFLLAEDSLGDTVRPRLDQHGANLLRIEAIEAVKEEDGSERSFSLADHLEMLEQRVTELDAALLVIDPLSAFLTSRNRNDDGDIRDLLTPLGKLAERCNVAILGVMHVGKPGAVKKTPLQSLMGSTAFGAVARLALMVAPVPDSDRKLLAVIKSNLAKKPHPLEWSRPEDGPIAWHGESGHDLDALINGGGTAKHPRDDAEAFLTEALANGPRLSREVFEEAGQIGITERTLRRAAEEIGATYRKVGGSRNAPWYIGPPDTDWSSVEDGSAPIAELNPPQLLVQTPVIDVAK